MSWVRLEIEIISLNKWKEKEKCLLEGHPKMTLTLERFKVFCHLFKLSQTEPAFSFVFQDPKSKFHQNWTKTEAVPDLTCLARELPNSANWLCLAS